MFYVYVIRSKINGSLYKGHCEDIKERLKPHNAGQTKSIKHNLPYEIAYFEIFLTREEAIKREKYFKTSAGRGFIKTMLEE